MGRGSIYIMLCAGELSGHAKFEEMKEGVEVGNSFTISLLRAEVEVEQKMLCAGVQVGRSIYTLIRSGVELGA